MGSSGFRVRRLLTIIVLFLAFLAGFPGTGKAVQPLRPPLYVPKAFRQLEASVAGLKFYASPTSADVPMKSRAYSTSFNAETKFIWWEMQVKTQAKVDYPVTLIMWVTWQRADGTESNQSLVVTIPPNFQNPFLSGCWQDNRPGGWLPGAYRVSIQIDDIEVVSDCFEVFQAIFKDK